MTFEDRKIIHQMVDAIAKVSKAQDTMASILVKVTDMLPILTDKVIQLEKRMGILN